MTITTYFLIKLIDFIFLLLFLLTLYSLSFIFFTSIKFWIKLFLNFLILFLVSFNLYFFGPLLLKTLNSG